MTALATRIREARTERKFSQEALARACHVSLRTAHRWESGHAQPRYSDLLAIARALDLDADALVAEADGDPDSIRRKQFVARISTPHGLRDELLNALLADKRDALSGRRRLPDRRIAASDVEINRRMSARRVFAGADA